MDEIVNLFVNNGVAVAVVIYFLMRDWKFNDELHKTLTTLIDTVDALKDVVEAHGGTINQKKRKEEV